MHTENKDEKKRQRKEDEANKGNGVRTTRYLSPTIGICTDSEIFLKYTLRGEKRRNGAQGKKTKKRRSNIQQSWNNFQSTALGNRLQNTVYISIEWARGYGSVDTVSTI